MKHDTERAAFERWAKRDGLDVERHLYWPDGYDSGATDTAWLAWQAAKRHAKRARK